MKTQIKESRIKALPNSVSPLSTAFCKAISSLLILIKSGTWSAARGS